MSRPTFLMVPPEHFRVSYSINPWMKPEEWNPGDNVRAGAQWLSLKNLLESLGAKVVVFELPCGQPTKDVPDLVFTANHAVVFNGEAVVANYSTPERQKEEAFVDDIFMDLDISTLPASSYFEGAGDCIWDAKRDLFWMGYGQRSELASHASVAEAFGKKVISLELVDPRFYHLDTCFLPLPNGEIVYYEDAFSKASLEVIYNTDGDLIPLFEDEACNLLANAIVLGNNVVMAKTNLVEGDETNLKFLLEEVCDYKVHEVDLSMFAKSGGSAYCMTLRLDNNDERQQLRDWKDSPSLENVVLKHFGLTDA